MPTLCNRSMDGIEPAGLDIVDQVLDSLGSVRAGDHRQARLEAFRLRACFDAQAGC